MVPLNLAEVIIPILCTGILLPGIVLLWASYAQFKSKKVLSVFFLGLIAFFFGVIKIIYIISGPVLKNLEIAAVFHVVHQLFPLLFIVVLPYFLSEFLSADKLFRTIHAILMCIAGGLTLVLILAAFIQSDLFISFTTLSQDALVYEGFFGQGVHGPLFYIRDFMIASYLLYGFLLVVIYQIQHKSFQYSIYVFYGFLVIIYFAFNDLAYNAFGINLDFWGDTRFPRFIIGVTIFVFLSMWNATINFLRQAKKVEIAKESLEYMAYHDVMTDLPNRKSFYRDLARELVRLEKMGDKKRGVIIVELQRFRDFNESYGYGMGNKLLRLVSRRLIESAPGMTYRIGGDNFAVISETINNADEARELTEALRGKLAEPYDIAQQQYHNRFNLGIIMLPDDGATVDQICKNSFNLIKEVKRNQDSIVFFTGDIYDDSQRKIAMVNKLLHSLRNSDDFYLVYHPICAADGSIISAEALIRWEPEKGKMISPEIFIPLAESAGLMTEFGRIITQKVFADARRIQKVNQSVTIAINVSPIQLFEYDFFQFIIEEVKKASIDPKGICIEVTESAIMENFELGITALNNLKSCGFTVALDDFGTGYSSLAYLKRLPADKLKIDKAFVNSIPGSVPDEALVESIVALAKAYFLKIVAEGVERKDQLDYLASLGCSQFQGHYFSKPLRLEDLLARLG